MEPLGQDVEQKAPDEFAGRQRHRAVPRRSVAAVVLEAEGDATVIEANQSAVRDGDAVCVAGEIGEHSLGSGEGRLGINEPVLPLEWREVCSEGLAATQALDLTKERQPTRRMSMCESGQEEPPEQAGQHAPW